MSRRWPLWKKFETLKIWSYTPNFLSCLICHVTHKNSYVKACATKWWVLSGYKSRCIVLFLLFVEYYSPCAKLIFSPKDFTVQCLDGMYIKYVAKKVCVWNVGPDYSLEWREHASILRKCNWFNWFYWRESISYNPA